MLILNLANLNATQTTYINDINQPTFPREFSCQKYIIKAGATPKLITSVKESSSFPTFEVPLINLAILPSKPSMIAAIKTAIERFEIDFSDTGVRFRIFYPGFVKTPLTDKNDFKMPFLMDADKAAEIVYKKLLYSTAFEISFPFRFALIMRLITMLPWPLYKKVMLKKVQK